MILRPNRLTKRYLIRLILKLFTMIQKQLSYTYLHLNQKSRWFSQNKFQFVFKTVYVRANGLGFYPSFLSMKRPRVWLLPTGWDAIPYQGYPPPSPTAFHQASLTIRRYSFILKSRERHSVNKVTCPRTQHIDPYPKSSKQLLICKKNI